MIDGVVFDKDGTMFGTLRTLVVNVHAPAGDTLRDMYRP